MSFSVGKIFRTILMLSLLVPVITSAQNPLRYIKALEGDLNQVRKDSFVSVKDSMLLIGIYDKIDTPYRVKNIVTFKINESSSYYLREKFNVSVNLRIFYKSNSSSSTVDSLDKILRIEYDPSAPYKSRNSYIFSNGRDVKVKILSIDSSVLWNATKALMIENEMVLEINNKFTCSNPIQQVIFTDSSKVNADELFVSWSSYDGANEYDLEWAYIGQTALRDSLYGSPLDTTLIFLDNATRVSVSGTKYSIPLMYDDSGSVFIRIRPIQQIDSKIRLEGRWTTTNSSSQLYKYDFIGHERQLNWQSSTTFAEEGKRKVVVQYFDGSLRSRQTVTKDNTTNTTIVSETFYDYQGRPAIQVLPAPTLNNIIQFSKNFNIGLNGSEYDKSRYDALASASSYCNTGADSMKNTSGASQYYSANNPAKTSGFNKFIPDAQFFPFTETKYTQDNTGRISAQSGVGPIFKLGTNRETKYFYGTPDRNELDALFGTEAGDASHYFKNMVRDANGQYSVSYVDMHGRTVATALAGTPASDGGGIAVKIDNLTSNITTTITETLSNPNTAVIKDLVIESKKGLLVSKAGKYTFKYTLNPESLRKERLTADTICYDCLYDLRITITDDCNNQRLGGKAFDTLIRNFSLDTIDVTCTPPKVFSVTFEKDLAEGSYEITKQLSLSRFAIDYYRDSLYFKDTAFKSLNQFIALQRLKRSFNDCQPVCSSCIDSVGTWSSFKIKYGEIIQSGADTSEAWFAYQEALENCNALCSAGEGDHDDLRRAMLLDVMAPSGQYANLDGDTSKYSIFYGDDSNLPPYRRDTVYYVDETGKADFVYDELSGLMVSPHDLTAEQFAQKFKTSWSSALLKFHPEYKKLVQYETFKSSNIWDRKFLNTETYQQALDSGYLNPTANSTSAPYSRYTAVASNKDPLSVDNSFKTLLENKISIYKTGQTINNTTVNISMYSMATLMVKCDSITQSCLNTFNNNDSAFANMCTGDFDMAWRNFRQMYLDAKRDITEQQVGSVTGVVSPQTLFDSGYISHFNDVASVYNQNGVSNLSNITSIPAIKDSANAALNAHFEDNCLTYAKAWVQQLEPCKYDSTALYNVILPRLIQVCKEGSDLSHPYGSSSVKPSSSYTYRSFEHVITEYNQLNNINDSVTCNAYLITVPKPYDNQVIYGNKPIWTKPDTCECEGINSLYSEYQLTDTTEDSFSDFLLQTRNTSLSDSVLNTLLDMCNSTTECKFLSQPISLPPALQCYSGNICISCDEADSLYQSFRAKYPSVIPTIEEPDTIQRKSNQLFAGFMNTNLGYGKQAGEYLQFIENCKNAVVDTTSWEYPGPNSCLSCDSIQSLVNSYFASLDVGAGSENGMINYIKNRLDSLGFYVTSYNILNALSLCNNSYKQNIAFRYRGVALGYQKKPALGFKSDNFTIEGWIYPEVLSSDTQTIAINSNTNFKNFGIWKQGFMGYRLFLTGGQLHFQAGDFSAAYNAGGSIWIKSDSVISNKKWHHVVVERIGNKANNFKIYIDGQLQSKSIVDNCDSMNVGLISTNEHNNMMIGNGSFSGSSVDHFRGMIKNLRAYKRSLPDSVVFNNFNCTELPTDTTAMVLWLKMNEASGDVYDYSLYQHQAIYVSFNQGNTVDPTWSGGGGPAVAPACLPGNDQALCTSTAGLPKQYLCGKSEPVFPDVQMEVIDNCSDSTFFDVSVATEMYKAYRDSLKNVFDSSYITKCLQAYKFETFTVTHPVSEYHHTLYYYDQAGNLVKTVPPLGVKASYDTTWLKKVRLAKANGTVEVPKHTYLTEYRYNSLNQVVAQKTPDAGESKFWYDRLGRLAVSQNSKQKVSNLYSYTLYDVLGRITEVGELTSSAVMTENICKESDGLNDWLDDASSTKTQITKTIYDQTLWAYEPALAARNLRNRVSGTFLYNTAADLANNLQSSASFYSYDIHGNVDTLLQDYNGLAVMDSTGNRFKKVVYKYDLISGKVNHVAYQANQPDAFYHRYSYDAENRITDIETSRDSLYWEKEAYYRYYKHGPLARAVIGQQQVQGIDYAYTLQGWLKGINTTVIRTDNVSYDMGSDGLSTSKVARDAYGFALYYYAGNQDATRDYKPIVQNPFALWSYYFDTKSMYNGNIAVSSVHIPAVGTPRLYAYTYDQLNRLKAMKPTRNDNMLPNNGWGYNPPAVEEHRESITYDANGNILTYLRNGDTTGGKPRAMDNLTYNYIAGTNKLDHIRDAVARTNYTVDIDDQAPQNYLYDEIGNLVKDKAEGISDIEWTVYGKIKKITKTNGSSIVYSYDPSGNRISKNVISGADTINTFYVRDAQGNVLSLYRNGVDSVNEKRLTQTELHMYGSSRLGIYNTNKDVSVAPPPVTDTFSITFERGNKHYELSNHLGNVMATVTDKKLPIRMTTDTTKVERYTADVVTANDYYPFGMQMPGRAKYQSEIAETKEVTSCVSCAKLQQHITDYFTPVTTGSGTEAAMLTSIQAKLLADSFSYTTAQIQQALLDCNNSWKKNVALRGNGAYVIYEAPPRLRFTQDSLSLEAWIYPKQETSVEQHIALYTTYKLYLLDGRVYFQVMDYSAPFATGGSAQCRTVNKIDLNKWHHIVAVRKGNYATNYEIYVDGVLQQTEVADFAYMNSGNLYNVAGTRFVIGNGSSSGSNVKQFNGNVRHVRVYRRPVTASEAESNYNSCSSTPTDTTGLVLWSKIDEGTGGYVTDYSAYNYTGSLSNVNAWGGGVGNSVAPSCITVNEAILCNTRTVNIMNRKGYRYGFNGKENDNEPKSMEASQQDYGFRIYDPRVGRFLTVDPLTKSYPFYTPYQFASNSPIASIDLDGLEGLIATGMPLGNSGVSHGMVITAQDASKINRNVAIAAFKAVFSEAIPKKFIDHYAYGKGKQYTLNKAEAVNIKSAPVGLKGIVAADKEKFKNLLAGAKNGSKITLPEGYSIQGAATTGGTLGRFTTNLTGTITIDKNDASKWTFEGTMQFNDTWDFKTNAITDKDLQRSDWGDIQTKIGGKFLAGQGFEVTSEVIPVKQTSSDASFDWYKGKPANGKQNEITNDMQNNPQEAKEAIKTGKSG